MYIRSIYAIILYDIYIYIIHIDRLRKTGDAAGENIGIEASLSVVWFPVPKF